MTYVTGGSIQALDYNTFATLSASMNEVYADLHPGATALPNAGYGYGQLPALTPVSIGNPVLASEWADLFQTMRRCGGHQGTTVVPPLPIGDPSIGDLIEAFNSPSTMATLVSTLITNRFNLAPAQSTLIVGTSYAQPAGAKPWTNTLTWDYQVDFSTWDYARYFFNAGGYLALNGSYSPILTPEDTQWSSMLTAMSPLIFNYNSTTPNTGTGGTSLGFYNLTTSYQQVYYKTYGSGYYYSGSSITVFAKLNAVAGTNGLVDFRIVLTDADVTPNSKTTTTTYRVDNLRATGSNIVYPGPSVAVTTVGANSGFTAT